MEKDETVEKGDLVPAEVGRNIRRLRLSHGLSQAEFGALVGVSDKAVSTWENGVRVPRTPVLTKLANHFNISVQDILGIAPEEDDTLSSIPSDQARYLMRLYNNNIQAVIAAWQRAQDDHPVFDFTDDEILDDSKAARARGDLNREPPNVSPFPTVSEMPGKLVRFKVLASVHAGYNGIAREEVSTDVELVPLSELRGHKPGEYRVLRIEGTSMYPMFLSGDRVLVHCQPDIENGEVAVVIYNGDEATVKKVYKGHGYVELLPINPEYPPKRIEGPDLENFRVFGKVVRLMRNINA